MQSLAHTQDGKYRNLLRELRSMGTAMVAFSGGLDSTFLLQAAHQALADDVLAVTLVTSFMPAGEIEEAQTTAQAMAVRHRLLKTPFPEALRSNPPDRCYRCKHSLFTRLWEVAATENIAHVLDGTNLDDLDDHRPGMKALGELGVKSPLLRWGQ